SNSAVECLPLAILDLPVERPGIRKIATPIQASADFPSRLSGSPTRNPPQHQLVPINQVTIEDPCGQGGGGPKKSKEIQAGDGPAPDTERTSHAPAVSICALGQFVS